ncbi:MAG: prefoldin subunit [archaeon]|nr:prefoldin subunit [archaeon]
METMEAIQRIVAEVQTARQQVANLKSQVQEFENTVVAIREQPEDKAILRQLGGVMVEVHDRKKLIEDLEHTIKLVSTSLERIMEREQQLIEKYDELKAALKEEKE